MPTPASMQATSRTSPALLLFLGFSMQSVNAGMIDKEGMAPWEICGLCHGLDGNSRMAKFPKLAGQKASYIEAQFNAFRHQLRTNDGGQMQAITEEVEPEDIRIIAEYFSRQPAPQPTEDTAIDSDLYRQGERLYTQGRESLPACNSCHDASRSDTPWLDAQHAEYIEKQLRDFRNADRHNDAENTMRNVASTLSEQEQKAVAHYLSRSAFRQTEMEQK